MMGRTRAETYRLMLAHKAAAGALEAALKDAAAEEFATEGVRITWALPGGGQVITSLTHDAAIVTDSAALLFWVEEQFPEQVQTVRQLRPAYLAELLKSVVPIQLEEGEPPPEDPTWSPGTRFSVVLDGDGVVVPGIRWVKGGGLASVSVRNDTGAVRRMNVAAAAYAGGTGAMPGLESGESSA